MRRKRYEIENSAILETISQYGLADEIEKRSAKSNHREALSPQARKLYSIYSWRNRAFSGRQWMTVITAVNVPVVAIDYLMSPTLILPGLALRGLAIPLVYAVARLAWTKPRPDHVEALSIIGFSACMMALACILGMVAGGAVYERYVAACFMVVSTSLAIIPLTSVWLLVACLVNCLAYAGAQLLNPAVDPTIVVLMSLFYGAVTLSLVRARVIASRVHVRSVMSYFRDLVRLEELRRLNLQLYDMATRDALTGLPNRAAIMEHLQDLLQDSNAFRSVSVALIDIDHFKKLNDTLGHLEGDRCLREIANFLATLTEARQGRVGRYGGEEFLLVLPDMGRTQAHRVCDELRRGVEQLGLPGSSHPGAGPVTISLGIACTRPARDTPATIGGLLQEADEALYEVKRSGRNNVSFASAR